ncbi:MAG: N-acetylglucosamine kinase [Acidobacteriota bacterium]
MRFLLGIDGGGTKTICLAADRSGQVVGEGRGGPSNYLREGIYATKSSLRAAISQTLEAASLQAQQIGALCAGLAGMDRPGDREVVSGLLKEILPVEHLVLENDAFIALAGATEGRPGVIVISGTGSIALGVNGRGKRARSGGWGHILGDEGSGYDIARRGLAAALQHHDGRGPKTIIAEKISRHFYLGQVDDLIPLLYGDAGTSRRVAALYPMVLEAAEEGDQVAKCLLETAVQSLLAMAMAVIEKLQMKEDLTLSLSGGVFRHSAIMRNRFGALLKEKAPGAKVIQPFHPPEYGAILLAKAALDRKPLFTSQGRPLQ